MRGKTHQYIIRGGNDADITRRAFLQTSAKIAIASFASPLMGSSPLMSGMDDKISVVMVHHTQVTKGLSDVDSNVLKWMLEKALIEFTGEKTLPEAWSKCLPQLQSQDTVGIKINSTGYCPTRPELVSLVIEGLIEAGLKENNIIIFDHLEESMKKLRYWDSIKHDVRYIGSNKWDFDSRFKASIESQGKKVPLTKILTQLCKYIINVPVLKDHNISGLSFSLKNAYGYIPLLWGTRMEDSGLIWAMHKKNAAMQIAELNANPVIREKTKLIIGDCLLCILDKGPMGLPQWAGNRLIIGKDPVAVDHTALKLLNNARTERGLREVTPRAGHIHYAARLGVGTNNDDKIELKRIDLS